MTAWKMRIEFVLVLGLSYTATTMTIHDQQTAACKRSPNLSSTQEDTAAEGNALPVVYGLRRRV